MQQRILLLNLLIDDPLSLKLRVTIRNRIVCKKLNYCIAIRLYVPQVLYPSYPFLLSSPLMPRTITSVVFSIYTRFIMSEDFCYFQDIYLSYFNSIAVKYEINESL